MESKILPTHLQFELEQFARNIAPGTERQIAIELFEEILVYREHVGILEGLCEKIDEQYKIQQAINKELLSRIQEAFAYVPQ